MTRTRGYGWFVLAVAAIGTPGSDTVPRKPVASVPRGLIVDGSQGGGAAGFAWLPPMVPLTTAQGGPVPNVSPEVRIDEVKANGTVRRTLAVFTRKSGPGGEVLRVRAFGSRPQVPEDDRAEDRGGFFVARWHSSRFALSPDRHYRVRVRLEGRELGLADVDVVATAAEAARVDPTRFVPLVNGKMLRIKFRLAHTQFGDVDKDGVPAPRDNCPSVVNPDRQQDDGLHSCVLARHRFPRLGG
jgi:hypothetical protein